MTKNNHHPDFILLKEEFISDIKANTLQFEHIKTKAKVVAIKNDDTNKFFGICFKTIPLNSTGLPHILEHSVLSGSKKYPIKELFGELVKSGLRTFLNAMTYSERTCYPFASQNSKEYFQTMDVYLDVVFNPLLAENTFKREGWHLDVDEKNNLFFNGIVFNEMKGAFSDPDQRMSYHTYCNLLPNSTYTNESGGLPLCIPDLSFAEFKNFHANNYHPSNSVTVLYGDANIAEELSAISRYFSNFELKENFTNIAKPSTLKNISFFTSPYPCAPSDTLTEKTWHRISTLVGSPHDGKLNIACKLLSSILFNSEASPLKKDLLAAGICKEVEGYFDSENTMQTTFNTTIKASEPEFAKKYFDVYKQSLETIVKNGFDHDLIEAEVASFITKLKHKNANAHRGLSYMTTIFSAFTYESSDLTSGLKVENTLNEVAQDSINNRLLEKIIANTLLQNPQTIVQSLHPSHNCVATEDAAFAKKLNTIKQNLTEQQINKIKSEAAVLRAEVETPNSPEAVQCLPKITTSDIDINTKILTCTPRTINGATVLTSDLYTNGLILFKVGFDASSLSEKQLNLLMPLASLICTLGTKKLSCDALAKNLAKLTAGLIPSFRVITQANNPQKATPMLWFAAKILPQNIAQATALLADIFQNINFSDAAKTQEILDRDFTNAKGELSTEGRYVPYLTLLANNSPYGKYSELVQGFSAYEALKIIKDKFKTSSVEIISELTQTCQQIFAKNNLIINIGSDLAISTEIETHLSKFINSFPENHNIAKVIQPSTSANNIAYINNADVVYAATSINIAGLINPQKPINEVVANYLQDNYLLQKIRLLGGAYGVWASLNRTSGDMSFISYRDPNVAKTFAAFAEIPLALKNTTLSANELEQLLISTFGTLTPLLSPDAAIDKACNNYLSGITVESQKNTLREIFTITAEAISAYGNLLETLLGKAPISIIGNKNKIMEDKHLFDKFIEIT